MQRMLIGGQDLIFVDLDGSLLLTDSLWEGFILLCTQTPRSALRAVYLAATKGIAPAKRYIAERAPIDAERLPVHQELLAFLEGAHQVGATIVLATAADRLVAERIQRVFLFFHDVLASDGVTNLKAGAKCAAIMAYANGHPFAYVGNDRSDLCIWEQSSSAYCVSGFFTRVPSFGAVTFTRLFLRPHFLCCIPRLLRVQHWFKNFLIFAPMLLAHRFFEPGLWGETIVAFISFSLAASSIYILNDILDAAHDRQHPKKRSRSFASGVCPVPFGLLVCISVSLFAYGLSGIFLGPTVVLALLTYQAVALAYSLRLKRVLLVDVFLLGLFYTYRFVIGSLATGILLSHWLLGFAAFFFLSLALLKRYAELIVLDAHTMHNGVSGRDYQTEDKNMLSMAGIASAFASSLMFVLYIHSEEVRVLYRHPSFLWGVSLCILFWLLRMWMLARREQVNDDPLMFSLTDWASYAIIACIMAVSFLASV